MQHINHFISAVMQAIDIESATLLATDLADLGFDVITLDEKNVLVSGEVALFENTFAISVRHRNNENGNAGVFFHCEGDGSDSAQWLIGDLPDAYRERIKEAEFEQPISFGPNDF